MIYFVYEIRRGFVFNYKEILHMKIDPKRVRKYVCTFDGNWRVLNCES